MTTAQTVKVTLQAVGPIKRSTFQREQPDRIDEAVSDILHWSWSTRLQVERLRRSLRLELKAFNLRPRLLARRHFSTTTYDEHLLFVAGAHLDRALRSAPRTIRREIQMPEPPRRALSLLRDVYEHWDELRRQYRAGLASPRGAAKRLKAEFPDADPWSFSFDPATGEIVLADVVALLPFVGHLRRLEARLLRLERQRKRVRTESADG